MNTMRSFLHGKPKATRHTIPLSRGEGSLGLRLSEDNVVTGVVEGSAAESGGILVGDHVVTFCGQPLEGRKLVSLLAAHVGSELQVEVERGGAERRRSSSASSMAHSASELKSPRPRPLERGSGQSGSFAAPGETVVSVLLSRQKDNVPWGLEMDRNNRVNAVMADSVAAKAGLLVGDIVTKIDGRDLGETVAIVDPDMNDIFYQALRITLMVRRGIAFSRGMGTTQRRLSVDL